MTTFTYQAINEIGRTLNGVIEAESKEQASNSLAEQGYIPISLFEREKGGASVQWQNIKERMATVTAKDLILFSKQFRTMLRAGVSMLTILQTLQEQTENLKLKRTVGVMHEEIRAGATLYDSFRKHPQVFPPLYCSMILAGEQSGSLPDVLDRLIYIVEHEEKVKSDIKSALQYPIMVVVFLSIAFFILLTFVVPQFVGIFQKAGLTLPLPTKICMVLYNLLAEFWYLLLGAAIGGIILLRMYLKTSQGRYVRDAAVMRIPVFGPLFVKSAMSRFASIFAILQLSGVSVLESMKILSGTIGNSAIAREFDRVRGRLEEGRGIAAPLKAARYFTPMVINMVAIGEESGNLDEMLNEVSHHYDDEVAYAMKGLTDALGPFLIAGLAMVVGFFALAIFLPMWDLTKMVQ